MSILAASLLLFLVTDPVGNIPIVLALMRRVDAARRRWVIVRESLVAFTLMVLSLFFGSSFLRALGVDAEALEVAGGIVLFIIALRLLFPDMGGVADNLGEGEPLIVPLAVPLLAGPGALTTVMILAGQAPGGKLALLAALSLAWSATVVVLLAAEPLGRLLGERGLQAAERLMGMLVTVIAVDMVIAGLRQAMSR